MSTICIDFEHIRYLLAIRRGLVDTECLPSMETPLQ